MVPVGLLVRSLYIYYCRKVSKILGKNGRQHICLNNQATATLFSSKIQHIRHGSIVRTVTLITIGWLLNGFLFLEKNDLIHRLSNEIFVEPFETLLKII